MTDVLELLDQDEQELFEKLERVRALKAGLSPTGPGGVHIGMSLGDVIARQKESSVRYALAEGLLEET